MDDIKNFKVNRTQLIREMYADETSRKKRQDETISGYSSSLKDAAAVYEALKQSFNNTENVIDISTKLYAVNPIYKQILDYMSNMYMWRYRVTPHFNIIKQNNNKADFSQIYNLMLEVVDGLSIETKFPAILTKVFMQGATYITTYCDEETLTINTLILPTKYCRKVGETQYGTAIVEFDCSYFDDLGLDEAKLNVFFDSFPAEFLTAYKNYKKDSTLKWAKLDSRFTTGIMCNEFGIPTYLYALGGILDFEKYQSNELERNDNTLKYIVSHKMPIYQDKTVFEMDEVNTLHKSLRKIIDRGEKTRLITTYGDISLLKVAENDTSENQVLSKAFKAIFNNAGLNSAIFTAESVESLKLSLVRDKGIVWNYIQSLLNFYTIAINN